MDINDLTAIKTMMGDEYRRYDDDYYHDRHEGTRATALGFGIAGLSVAVVGIGAAMLYANAKGCAAMRAADMNANNISMLNSTLLNEMNARQLGDNGLRNEYTTATNRVADKIDIVNTTATSANSSAASWANAEATLAAGVLSQQYRICPQEVSLVSKQYCPCPASNSCSCGCNG